ncbi:hypothetical protein MJ561_27585 [Klebsiella pneumoniae]|nr:hypothetical protein MJ561_27585 [Klebsiella pneumoniae]
MPVSTLGMFLCAGLPDRRGGGMWFADARVNLAVVVLVYLFQVWANC